MGTRGDDIFVVLFVIALFIGISNYGHVFTQHWDEGHVAIGYGHNLSRTVAEPDDIDPITEERAEQLLDRDLAVAQHYVNLYVGDAGLDAHQEAALIDFVYNLGPGHLQTSTLREVINAGNFDRVPTELRKWVYAGGHRSAWLERRREAEVRMWKGDDWQKAIE